jgi:hypothetical protein
MTVGNCDQISSSTNRRLSFFVPLSSILYPPVPSNMPLLYSDAFQDDEDLCNILATMQLGNRPTSGTAAQTHPPNPITHHSRAMVGNDPVNRTSTAITQQEMTQHQESSPATAANSPRPLVHDQPSANTWRK